MLQAIWGGMMLVSIVYALASGNAAALLPGAISGAQSAVELTMKLLAGYLFFCGVIEIVKALGVPGKLGRALSPLLRRLLPAVERQETKDAIVLNLAANMLGLGNAATPMGIRAMELMDEDCPNNSKMLAAMYMFLVINATSLQLVPTTILSLRVAAGSADPTAVLLPTLVCTLASAVVGVSCALLCARFWRPRRVEH